MNDTFLQAFETYLQQEVSLGLPSRVRLAMEYSLCAPGKRLRPRLLFAALEGYGKDPLIGFAAASAVEMVHAYSLIHDDLPAMDDDDLRRGRATCHKKFDEASAILAGDGLLTQAFEQVLKSKAKPGVLCAMVNQLSQKSGADGMIYGQDLDMFEADRFGSEEEKLLNIHLYKTGQLLQLPLVFAALLSEAPQDIRHWSRVGALWGQYFQIQDDILDIEKTSIELGKSNSDVRNEKFTAVGLYGLSGAKEKLNQLEEQILKAIENLQGDHTPIMQLFMAMKNRIQ